MTCGATSADTSVSTRPGSTTPCTWPPSSPSSTGLRATRVWAAAHRAVVNEASSRAAAILRAGVDRGTVRADLDVARAVEAVLSPFLYTRMVRFETITPAMEDRVLADLIERFGAAGTSMSRRGTRSLSPVPRAE